jgi:hypothetical protein
MKLLLLPISAILVGVSATTLPDQPLRAAEGPRATMRELPVTSPADCRDRIERVRDELGQPGLEREPASPERPFLIAAVDKRIDGCAVMQMKGDVNDLRPLPEAPSGPPRIQPAR